MLLLRPRLQRELKHGKDEKRHYDYWTDDRTRFGARSAHKDP